jgi:hypothetical protein
MFNYLTPLLNLKQQLLTFLKIKTASFCVSGCQTCVKKAPASSHRRVSASTASLVRLFNGYPIVDGEPILLEQTGWLAGFEPAWPSLFAYAASTGM